jgi:putative acetyltransferase
VPVRLRIATPSDVPAIAALFRRSRHAKLPYLPDLHSEADDLVFFGGVIGECNVIVAEHEAIVGFIAWKPGWVDHLYVDPRRLREGLGSILLAEAMAAEVALKLYAFQRNTDAIAFYERHGFRTIETTDGAGNEEKEPDALLAWSREG